MKKKTFDCVQMKWDIQRKQREELAGMSEADRRRVQTERIQADPIFGPFVQRLKQAPPPSSAR
ncbi:MAG: hypothetical protein IH987_18755 [Planctomycetes bacterium]|nr:hypothetical protein [Planctomycetota bacterium]